MESDKPDGNVYAVFDIGGDIGAVSLTPGGALRWNNPGNPRVAEFGQLGRELVFGGDNFYFTSTYYGDVYGFELTQGRQRFYVNICMRSGGSLPKGEPLRSDRTETQRLFPERSVPMVVLR